MLSGPIASAARLRRGYRRSVPASSATVDDLDWIVDLLAARRAPLVECAPVFWRPAPDATSIHRGYLESMLRSGGHAYRTANAALIATPRGDGWLVDDAHVADQGWSATSDGHELWRLFAADWGGSVVRFVCPTYEYERAAFARSVGLGVQESWWLRELSGSGGRVGVEVDLPGAAAVTVAAPPIYTPPGPVMFLPDPADAVTAVPAAVDEAVELGCAALVVRQRADDGQLAAELMAAGLRRHCDYFSGPIRSV